LRKLTWAALSYAAAVFMMHYWDLGSNALILVSSLTMLGLVACFLLRDKMRIRALLFVLFALLGVLRYDVHYRNTVVKFEDFIGEEIRITAELCEYPVVYEDSVKYTVKLDTDLLPNAKAVVYDYTTSETCLFPGNRFRATVKFHSALLSSGEETDTYVSKGIYVRGYVVDEVITVSDEIAIKYLPVYFADSIRSTLSDYLPNNTYAFLSALMTGDKSALYEDSQLNYTLTQAGLSHVVAVSGMHVSFVVALAMMLFGQRIGWTISIVFILLFAVMTGMPPSVLRAVFMQSLFLLAPVLRREADGITSICFALFILLLVNPFAISSVGLQLSFLAMAGIILVTPRSIEWFERKCPFTNDLLLKGYRFVTMSLSSSLGATIFTAPLCAYYFGSVSVLAPLTNLLVLWIVPICFGGGFLLCVIDFAIPFAASAAAFLLNMCVSFVLIVSEQIASTPIASVYLPERLILIWFIEVYSVMGIMLLFRKKSLYRPLPSILVAVIGLTVFSGWTQHTNNSGMTVAALDVGQGQCVAVLADETTVVADCGGTYDSGEIAARWLRSHGRRQIDALLISHFDEDHMNGVLDLMMRVPVKKVILCGNNITDEELQKYNEIRTIAEENHAKLILVNTESELRFDSVYCRIVASGGDDSNDGLMTYLQSGGYEILIMGDADFEAEGQLMGRSWLNEVDCLVVGHHGSSYSTGDMFLERVEPKSAIISCGFNTYGHPSDEVLDRLQKKNVVIYRTDQMGTIEIKVR